MPDPDSSDNQDVAADTVKPSPPEHPPTRELEARELEGRNADEAEGAEQPGPAINPAIVYDEDQTMPGVEHVPLDGATIDAPIPEGMDIDALVGPPPRGPGSDWDDEVPTVVDEMPMPDDS